MSDATITGAAGTWSQRARPARPGAASAAVLWRPPDARRTLQLGLAAIWLIDGVLQMQPFMFSPAFGHSMLAPMAAGNPSSLAHAIAWSSREIGNHATLANAVFCVVQIALGLGIAARVTTKVALAVSIVWAGGVWWLGEGLGGIFGGGASPLTGAPGAVLIYALLAVLLWPTDNPAGPEGFVAARSVGARRARFVWAAFWLAMAAMSLETADRTRDGISSQVSAMVGGEPRWLSVLVAHVASALSGEGLLVSAVFAGLCVLFALGVFAGTRAQRVTCVAVVAASLVIWLGFEALGGMLSGSGTDPNSGPLLALLALCYWPLGARAVPTEAGLLAGEGD